MARSNLLNTGTATFLELIGNGRLYRVPPYQRDYSWTEEQWEDLWADVCELVPRPEDTHYMGALVVEAESDRRFSVIDGQQRIATLSVLTLVVIGRLQALADAGVDPEANRERARQLRSRFIGEKDPASLVEASKLTLNENDDGFYQEYLVQLRVPRNPRRLPESNRLLWACFTYFQRQVEAWSGQDGQRLAQLVSETLGRQLLFIRIAVDNELNAYTVFETLNARGLELSATDLLKNYLFSRLATAADRSALQRRWRNLMETVRQERFPEFLRYHLQCELPRVRSQRLFKLVRERVQNASAVFALMDVLEARSEVYAALFDPQHEYWIERPGCVRSIQELKVLRVRQLAPLVFAAWERFGPEDLARLLKLVVVVLFRYSTVSRLNPNALEPVFHEAARGLLDRSLRTPADVFRVLAPVYVDDDAFRQAFATMSVAARGQNKGLVRYVLARLESDASGRDCDWETDPGTIEHILPENPTAAWDESFPSDQADRWIDRIGNFTWLEATANRRAGGRGPAEKAEIYRGSAFALTRAVAGLLENGWTSAMIDRRQHEMAARAVHLWRSDFA